MIPKVLFEDDGRLSIEDIHMGMAKVGKIVENRRKYAILNKEGDFVSDYEYEIVRAYSEGYAVVANYFKVCSRDNSGDLIRAKYGIVDMKGDVVVPLIYDEIGRCSDGVFPAKRLGRWGYIEPNGNIRVPFIYEEARSFSDNLAAVMLGNKYGFIDKDGRIIISFKYIWVHDFSDGVCFVQNDFATIDDYISYIDKKGKLSVRVNNDIFGKYGMPSDYCKGIMVLDRNKGVNKEGKIDFELEEKYHMKHYNDGIACVFDTDTEKYGFVDNKGEFVVPCKYEKCIQTSYDNFPGGMIGVQNSEKKWGIIDYTGNEIVPLQYNKLHGYSNGRILVSVNDRVCSIEVSK